jgi:SAM-dependent methyltransferase
MSRSNAPNYLQPYSIAAERFGGGFGSLLWASPRTQRARFEALARLVDFNGRSVLDLGCGRCDFLEYLLSRSIVPKRYVGVEAIAALVETAREKVFANAEVIDGDFVKNPQLMEISADVVVFSGSLNTLEPEMFRSAVHSAFTAAGQMLAFNFLSTPLLAGKPFLHWYQPADVVKLCRELTPDVSYLTDYLDGDCTMVARKKMEHSK